MSGHYRPQQPDRRISLWQSPTQCVGATVWVLPVESGWQRVPLGEGQASLGEALVTVHICRLLLLPHRRFNGHSPTCYHCPRKGGQVRGGGFPVFLFNIIHNRELLPRTLHCKLYYLQLCIQKKKQ